MKQFNYEIIDDYLNRRLTGAGLTSFEKELNEGGELAKEVALYALIEKELKNNVAEDKDQDAVKTTLSDLSQRHFNNNKTTRVIKLWPFAAAAAAAILLFIFFNPFSNDKFDNKELYSSYSGQLYQFSPTERGVEDSLILKAAILYNKNNFSEALPLLAEAQKNFVNDELKLVIAICLLKTNKDDEAITALDRVIAGKSVYIGEALWYKAMLLLKQNKLQACSGVLKLISPDSDKYKDAQDLSAKIKPHL